VVAALRPQLIEDAIRAKRNAARLAEVVALLLVAQAEARTRRRRVRLPETAAMATSLRCRDPHLVARRAYHMTAARHRVRMPRKLTADAAEKIVAALTRPSHRTFTNNVNVRVRIAWKSCITALDCQGLIFCCQLEFRQEAKQIFKSTHLSRSADRESAYVIQYQTY
jgi:hypothetical protein